MKNKIEIKLTLESNKPITIKASDINVLIKFMENQGGGILEVTKGITILGEKIQT